MSSTLKVSRLEDTTLWKRLNEGFNDIRDEEIARDLATKLKSMCKSASDRMKIAPSLHKQYTLHDETHLLNVTELMASVMPEKVLKTLNPIELALLILSAYYHDQGMVLTKEEFESLSGNLDFKSFSSNWEIEHPNLLEIRQQFTDRSLTPKELSRIRDMEQELLIALRTNYIRETHARRSAEFVRSHDNNPLWMIDEITITDLAAKLCESHTKPAYELTSQNGFHYDELIAGYSVNMVYLGLVLRLADILDFDRDRTPDAIYKTIHFTDEVSLMEWAKHRSVYGWKIDSKEIMFTMKCEHPIYQRAALEFMNWIDNELTTAKIVAESLPNKSEYYFDLPPKTDRSRIKPKDDAYIYDDLEFSLSRNEIVKLLMMNELYHAPSLCVRELIQNSLDALRYRKALLKRDTNADWNDGKVQLVHTVDDNGYEILRCTDNGVGMDKDIIKNSLTKVGRSYYRSYNFEQERTSFRDAGVDFDPCSQFGIGFMSCFMIGDHITIHTRRDYGPKRGIGDPLIVEINGLNSMVVIRKGSDNQEPGTTVEIKGRKKPPLLDKWNDIVQLTNLVKGYALACEFPIEADRNIPGIEDAITIDSGILAPETEMEKAGIKSIRIFEQNFSEIDSNLAGSIRISILLDNEGKLAVENDDAKWIAPSRKNQTLHPILQFNEEKIDISSDEGQVCLDGILVCGKPGGCDRIYGTKYPDQIGLGINSFVLDTRGPIKPPLTPSRGPPNDPNGMLRVNPQWKRLRHLAHLAYGRLWEKISDSFDSELDFEVFWQLATIHNADIRYMRSGKIWSQISVPLIHRNEDVEWRKISSLGKIRVVQDANFFRLITYDGAEIKSYDKIDRWRNTYANSIIKYLIIDMSTIILNGQEVYLEVREPTAPNKSPLEFILAKGTSPFYFISLPYIGAPKDILAIQLPFQNVNRDHPLVREALSKEYLENQSEFDTFAKWAVNDLSDDIPNLAGFLEVLPHDNKGYSMCHFGHRYLMVDWSKYNEELRPPYKIWSKVLGTIQVTEEHFKKWARSDIKID